MQAVALLHAGLNLGLGLLSVKEREKEELVEFYISLNLSFLKLPQFFWLLLKKRKKKIGKISARVTKNWKSCEQVETSGKVGYLFV